MARKLPADAEQAQLPLDLRIKNLVENNSAFQDLGTKEVGVFDFRRREQ